MAADMAGIQMIYSDPDLKPRESHNFNLALEHAAAKCAGHAADLQPDPFRLLQLTTTDASPPTRLPQNRYQAKRAIYTSRETA